MNKKTLITLVLVLSILGIFITQNNNKLRAEDYEEFKKIMEQAREGTLVNSGKTSLTTQDFAMEVTVYPGEGYFTPSQLEGWNLIPSGCRTDRKIEVIQTRFITYKCWRRDANSGVYTSDGFTKVHIGDIKCTQKLSEKIIKGSVAVYNAYNTYPTDGCLTPGNY